MSSYISTTLEADPYPCPFAHFWGGRSHRPSAGCSLCEPLRRALGCGTGSAKCATGDEGFGSVEAKEMGPLSKKNISG